jgi:hypothetical protein
VTSHKEDIETQNESNLVIHDPVISENTILPTIEHMRSQSVEPAPVAELREHESTIKILNLKPRKLRRTKKSPLEELEGFKKEYLVFKYTRKSAYLQKRKSRKRQLDK